MKDILSVGGCQTVVSDICRQDNRRHPFNYCSTINGIHKRFLIIMINKEQKSFLLWVDFKTRHKSAFHGP